MDCISVKKMIDYSRGKFVMKKFFKIIKKIIIALIIILFIFCIYSFIFHRIQTNKENKILKNYDLGEVINIDGYDINYKIFNKDNTTNTIVFLQGLSVNDIALSLEPFAKKINSRIILINRPGYALSSDSKDEATLDYVVEYYRKTLKSLNINEDIFLMPSSLGGLYAIHWINKYPNEIKGMIALDITCPYLVVNDKDNYSPDIPINTNDLSYKITSNISRMYGFLGIHRQLYLLGKYEKNSSYGYYSEDILDAMYYLSLQVNDKRFMLSENGYLYYNSNVLLKNIGEEYNKVSKLFIISNYIDGDFFYKYEKNEFLAYLKNEDDLNGYLLLLRKIRDDEINYFSNFENTEFDIIEGPHTIYEYPKDVLINTINSFINNY